jgi:tetratricopeptide (TPR) repeat protein
MNPLDIQNILDNAGELAKCGNYEEAEGLLKHSLVQYPDNKGIIDNLVDVYCKQGKAQAALDTLVEAVDGDPMCAHFYYGIGDMHKALGQSKAALMAYSKTVELDPDCAQAYNNLGIIYHSRNEVAKALTMFTQGISREPHDALLHYNYGVALETINMLDEAAAEYQCAIQEKGGWSAPLNNLGIIFYRQKRYDEAYRVFSDILHADPDNAEAQNNQGVVFAAQGQQDKAVSAYRQAVETDPRYFIAALNLGYTLESSGDITGALTELEKVTEYIPDNSDLKVRLGFVYLKAGRYNDALTCAQAVLDKDDSSIPALEVAGAAYRGLDDIEVAQSLFGKILVLDPNIYRTYLVLADIKYQKKKYKATEEQLKVYLVIKPGDVLAKQLLGTLYNEMWNLAMSIQVFEELYAINPNNADAVAMLTKLYTDTGADEELALLKEKAAPADSTLIKNMWERTLKQAFGVEYFAGLPVIGSAGMIEPARIEPPQRAESAATVAVPPTALAPALNADVPKGAAIIVGYKVTGLLRYLFDLVEYLPPKGLELFQNSDARRSMEFILSTLERRKGLLRNVQDRLDKEKLIAEK